ncbi:MAG: flagellar biosynthetic protein FliO [Spirochaetes bacterium]|nr:flagellar biosynthetic protein FliO [Spirochaetota bacterium]
MDNTDDAKSEYFKKVQETMKKDPAIGTFNSEKDNKNIKRLKIDYFSYFKIIILLVIIIFIIYALSYLLKRFLRIKGQIGEGASIVISHSLGPGKWLQVVNVFGKYLVLGITNDRINLLTEITDQKEIERIEVNLNTKKAEDGSSFLDIISDLLKNKFKKDKTQNDKFDYESDSVDFLKKQRERLDNLRDD